MDLVWENPPEAALLRTVRGGRTSKHEEIATALRSSPGDWLRIGTYKNKVGAAGTASQIRRARGSGSGKTTANAYEPAGAFEAVVDQCTVWARYVGVEGQDEGKPSYDEPYEDEFS